VSVKEHPEPATSSFGGVINRTMEGSRGWWPPKPSGPLGAPNVLVVLLDDVGYAQLGCYGSDIATPNFDRLAAEGLRYANFHTTALCSPTRACLLSGRNHHSNGMARVVDLAAGFPGYNAHIPKENGFLSEMLRDEGYATFCVGKWHLTPATEMAAGSPRDKWPLGRGFERYYGFMGGETDQFHPELVRDNQPVAVPRTPEEGYHLTEDLVDNAIQYLSDLRGADPDRPFLLWFAPGACHAPHQAPSAYLERYRGHFDQGWDEWREAVYARQLSSGLLAPETKLSERPSWVPAWEELTDDERRLAARLMEVFAGFMTHTDAQVGRLLGFIEALGELDNTIVILASDNGASAEGGPKGVFNEQYFFNFIPESMQENLQRLDDLGTPRANNHYPWGWAWAGNTPLKRFKRDTHEGGVADPLIVRWPARIADPGATRRQYVHAIDVLPTLLELIGVAAPDEIGGVAQSALEGWSFAATLAEPLAPSQHRTQYYEMLGSRAIYHDGWKAVVFHAPTFISYDGSDGNRPFEPDDWELYHVAEDFSEVTDLARHHPEKLAELVDLWWHEAERFQVLPLNNQAGLWGDPRYLRDHYDFVGHAGPMAEGIAPHLKNRSFQVRAALLGVAHPDGVIVAHGGHAGGFVMFVRNGRLRFTYNFVATQLTRVVAEVPLPPGSLEVTVEVTRVEFGGDVELRYGDVVVATARVPFTTPLTYGTPGFCVGFQPAGPIDPDLVGRGEMPRDAMGLVTVDASGEDPIRDPLLRPRVDFATQ
jgi:arylsulfatase